MFLRLCQELKVSQFCGVPNIICGEIRWHWPSKEYFVLFFMHKLITPWNMVTSFQNPNLIGPSIFCCMLKLHLFLKFKMWSYFINWLFPSIHINRETVHKDLQNITNCGEVTRYIKKKDWNAWIKSNYNDIMN